MRTSLHLVSMPMYDPLHPSAQLGYLHGHVKRVFGTDLPVRSYSAHTGILYALEGAGMGEYFGAQRLFGDEIFFLACCHEYPRLFERAYQGYMQFRLPGVHLSKEQVARLCEAMRGYLRDYVLPRLDTQALNVIGFTTTFAQLFASVFAALFLRRNSRAPLLFVFGGASMALPEANRALHLWGVEGLFVTGSGEAPLEKILNCCLDLPEPEAAIAPERILAANLVNVNAIGGRDQAIDLRLSREEFAGLGDPDYDEFFATLRSLCASGDVYEKVLKLVSLPLEGSRGCFARCDFCQNPSITSHFRTLAGERVAERARRLASKYRVRRLYFADSVCNTWAEDYADDLLRVGASYPAFMEMRVHAPEHFFTKLAMAGVNEMQLGIEAVSEPLLRAIAKGTTVLQNLRAAKYLCELQIESSSNLITHHPKSTVADVEETRRVVSQIPHFGPFCLSRFVISYASPIYNQLSLEQKGRLCRGFAWLADDLQPYSMVRDLAYPYPQEWLDPEVDAAWNDFRRWYSRLTPESSPTMLTVARDGDGLHVRDMRSGAACDYFLDGELAHILDLCHAGLSWKQLLRASGITEHACARAIDELVGQELVIAVDKGYLSLPLRPREELVARLTGAAPASERPRVPLLAVLS